MPWLTKMLLLALKTKRGRELLFAAALGAVEIVRSERAQELYTRVRRAASDPRLRRTAAGLVRLALAKVKR